MVAGGGGGRDYGGAEVPEPSVGLRLSGGGGGGIKLQSISGGRSGGRCRRRRGRHQSWGRRGEMRWLET